MRLAHIAWFKRSEGHAGGVPLFGHLMAKHLGAQEYSWSDASHPQPSVNEPLAAELLSRYLWDSGALQNLDAIIVDGFWGAGIPDQSEVPVFSVAHNTWRGIGEAMQSRRAFDLGEYQQPEYRRHHTVAVSESTARDLRRLYAVEANAVIHNGIDTCEFRPRPHAPRNRPLVLYPSDAPPKGGDIVADLQRLMPGIDFEVIGGTVGGEAEAIARGDALLTPSRAEGCSYARLQAMACELPVITSATGMFADQHPEGMAVLHDLCVGTIVGDVDTRPETLVAWAAAVDHALEDRHAFGRSARTWAELYGDIKGWAERWRQLVQTFGT
jgi:glycosyltransferase involved in cell wall biosynthesis